MNTEQYTKEYKAENGLKYVVIDIETIPNPDMLKMLPEPAIDSRLKDPAKVAQARIDAKDAQLAKMALSPLTGKVACIGYFDDTNGFTQMATLDAPDSEKTILDNFYEILTTPIVPITYNGKAFDIPFIFKRGIMLGCTWATIPEMKRFTDRYKSGDNHIDVMTEFCSYGEYEKLDNLSRYILGYGKPEFDVTQIAFLMKTPEGCKQVTDYCLADCEITWKLAKKMGFVK